MILLSLIAIPLVFAVLVAVSGAAQARMISLMGMLASSAVAVYGLATFDWANGAKFSFPWTISWL
ncbi:MAG: hypothetical protein NTV94_16110, partial [Planctomycetota bacterium]|nr:hypothetical protein [Planctomycetota bacterium]